MNDGFRRSSCCSDSRNALRDVRILTRESISASHAALALAIAINTAGSKAMVVVSKTASPSIAGHCECVVRASQGVTPPLRGRKADYPVLIRLTGYDTQYSPW